MASKLHIHKPYVLKALSNPLDRPDGPGRHTVGEVFGQKQDSKRRKRSELSVAIDGDAVHLYDILSSQALTSYLVPPQSFFTCPSYSFRWRPSSGGNAIRYTYISTQDSLSKKKEIKLFRDVPNDAGTTSTTTATYGHHCEKPIIYLAATSFEYSSTAHLNAERSNHNVVAIAANGTLMGLDGETLEERWKSSPAIFTQELSAKAAPEGFQVDYVQSTQAADVVDGLFDGKNELFGVFREKIQRDGFNPDVLIAFTSIQGPGGSRQRHMHILVLPGRKSAQQLNGQNVISVLTVPLPTQAIPAKGQLDVKSGSLQELANEVLYTYSIKGGIPRLENELQVPGINSFLRLSKSSVLTASATSLSIYNPLFRSLQSTTLIDNEQSNHTTSANEKNVPFCLATYLPGREIVVGLRGATLTAVQLEAPTPRGTKRRAEGLLVDAIRRGIPQEHTGKKSEAVQDKPGIIAMMHPEIYSEESWREWREASAKADELLDANDLPGFEATMADVFRVQVNTQQNNVKIEPQNDGSDSDQAITPASLVKSAWASSGKKYHHADRRWVLYAISKVFAWSAPAGQTSDAHLECRLPESNLLGYLVAAGHLTISNIKSAFKEQTLELDDMDNLLGEQVPPLLVDVDPTMDLLLGYLYATQLGPTELTSSVKLLLRSLDLLEDPTKFRQLQIADSAAQEQGEDHDVIDMELDKAEEELQMTEYYLGNDSGSRTRGLSVAFSKLVMCPAAATVQSFRRLFKPDEIVCLINVLRMELINDGWTRRYLDGSQDVDDEEAEAAPDGSIQLIAELMSRCIDSVGLGGWMAFDSMLTKGAIEDDESADFFHQVLTEVQVAYEGVQEAVRLQGALGETVRYARRARASRKAQNLSKGSILRSQELPFGLKADARISQDRVRGSGGEIVKRSSRQIGHFRSQKRAAYSVTRITEDGLLGRRGAVILKEEM